MLFNPHLSKPAKKVLLNKYHEVPVLTKKESSDSTNHKSQQYLG